MPATTARHRKPSHATPARPSAPSHHRKPAASAPRRRGRPAKVAIAAVTGSALLVSAWLAVSHWKLLASHPATVSQSDELGLSAGAGPIAQATASPSASVNQQPEIVGTAVVSGGKRLKAGQRAEILAGYRNPVRAVSGLVPERIDEGVDFGGSGPVYALGDAVVTSAGENAGWPGGGWITYRLTDGPDAGLMVYLAEDVTSTVQAGQHVTSSTVIANMFNGGDGIETGWAQPTGASAESQLPEAGGIGGGGPFPTMVGLNFDQLLRSLGAPAAPNYGQTAYGLLPASYPNIWG